MTTIQDPSNAEVEQYEAPELVTVPVSVDSPVKVQMLPSAGGLQVESQSLGTTPVRLLYRDPMRRHAIVLATDYSIYVGGTQAQCLAQSVAWPAGLPMPVTSDGDLWAYSAAVGGASKVMTVVERLF